MKKLLFISIFTFAAIIKANAQCSCGATTCWTTFTRYSPLPITGNIKCGHQFGLYVGDSLTLGGSYTCTRHFSATYKAELKKADCTLVRTYPPFRFPFMNRFLTAGNYVLYVYPFCNNINCTVCKFYISVKPR